MDLPLIWFLAIAVLWTGYLVLEGFDFGVGTLLPVLSRDDTDRRVMINSIGPVWDGNEVWLITAVGATFAAFPAWYASMLSGFYLPLLLIVLALIGRGVAMGPDHVVTTTVFGLFNGYAVLGGLLTLALFLLHGAVFLALKTDGPVRLRARAFAAWSGLAVLPLLVAFAGWTQARSGEPWTLVPALVSVVALALGAGLVRRGREGWAFTATTVAVAALAVLIFGSLFPDVLPSTTDPAFSLTVDNAASAPYTLTVMSWVAVVFLPLVLGYQAWSYWVFRKRVTRAHLGPVH